MPEHPLDCCPQHCPHPHHDEPRWMLRCDHLALCPQEEAEDIGPAHPVPYVRRLRAAWHLITARRVWRIRIERDV